MREYTDRIRVWIKPGDKEKIRKRMAEAGIRNMSAYIRKMAIDGYVIKLDLSDVKEVSRLLRINANNINQYAKRARLPPRDLEKLLRSRRLLRQGLLR